MTTTFHSTRSTTDSLTAKQAIRKGIADDGGLFVSDALGKTKVDVASLPGKSYQQIAAEVLGALLPDFTAEELGQCIADAYGEQLSDTANKSRQGSTLCSPTVGKILCRSLIVSALQISPCPLREKG